MTGEAKYRAVLFDLDGTLLDTIDDIADSMNAVLSRLGAPVHSPDSYKLFIGDGIEMLVRRALPSELADDERIAGFARDMRREYRRRWDAKTEPYPGIPELLDGLTSRNISMAILSNKAHELTVRIVEKLLAGWVFDPVFGSRVDVPNKPDPTGALELAEKRGIEPKHWLYLGDSAVDMKTATAAGMVPVGACWGFRGVEELRSNGARELIERPQQLLELL